MSKQLRQPDLPGCAKQELRFKDIPCTNGEGETLQLCSACEGSGSICSGVRTTYHKTTGEPTTEKATFPGSQVKKYTKRGGWDVTSSTCACCGGAGLKRARG